MLQTEARYRFGDAPRLIRIERPDLAMSDRTIGTIARANVAHQHESRRTMSEAFPDIRAARFLTNRMELELGQHRTRTKVLGRSGGPHFNPLGMFPLDHDNAGTGMLAIHLAREIRYFFGIDWSGFRVVEELRKRSLDKVSKGGHWLLGSSKLRYRGHPAARNPARARSGRNS